MTATQLEFCPGAGITTADVELIARRRFAGRLASAEALIEEAEQAAFPPVLACAPIPRGYRHGRSARVSMRDLAGYRRVMAAAIRNAVAVRDGITYEDVLAEVEHLIRGRAAEGRAKDNQFLARMAHVAEHGAEPVVRTCGVCGCTDMYSCCPPCSWAGPDICSACASSDPGLVPAGPCAATTQGMGGGLIHCHLRSGHAGLRELGEPDDVPYATWPDPESNR